MKMTRKILALLLALAMLCTVAPFGIAAEEVTEDGPVTDGVVIPEEPVAEDAVTDAIGTQIPVIGEKLPLKPWVNPAYEDIVDIGELSAYESTEKPDAYLQATYLTKDKAIIELRRMMKNRVEDIELNVFCYDKDPNVAFYDMLNKAMEHNGIPTEGDYLLGHLYGVGGGEIWYTPNGYGYNYTYKIKLLYMSTAAEEAAMNTAVANLLAQLNLGGKSDYDKIRGVYDYMCDNIVYDYDNLEDPTYLRKHSAYAALVDKKAVCQGYATLFYRLMMELGVDARYITGIGNGGGHAWNIVKLDGFYYCLDSTWDAGSPWYMWFLVNTWNFADHWEDSYYRSKEFRSAHPMAARDYMPGVSAELDPISCYGLCGENAMWYLSVDGEMLVTGTGPMMVSDDPEIEAIVTEWWDWARDDIRVVYVDEGITSIREHAFAWCDMLEEVYLSDTVAEIGDYAFYMDGNLKTMELGEGLVRIGKNAFEHCQNMAGIDLPETVRYIGANAFIYCSQVTHIEIPEGITRIEADTFNGCGLSEIILPSTLVEIGASAFYGNSMLKQITLPENLESIDADAFASCKNLKTITIPASVRKVGFRAFAWCYGLETIYFQGDAPAFGDDCFYGDDVTAYYPADNETWTEDACSAGGRFVTWLPDCEHQYETVVTPPTCTEEGYTTNTCTLCGMVTITDYVDALGHTPGEVQVENEVPATCTAKGSYDNVTYCTACGVECSRESVTVDELPHTPGEVRKENVQEPTCTEAGSYDNVICCTECGLELSRETVTVEMLPHKYTSVVTEPTCEADGCTTHTCTVCGHTYTDAHTDALGHDYTYTLTAVPGKFRTGTLAGTCSRCGVTDTVELPKVSGADYVMEVILEPTEVTEGLARYTWINTEYGTVTFQMTLPKLNSIIPGDVNGDKRVDAADAYLVALYRAGKAELDETRMEAADVNGDAVVDAVDAYYIVLYYTERIAAFPNQK